MQKRGVSPTWMSSWVTRRRRLAGGKNELSVQAHREFLGKFLRPEFESKESAREAWKIFKKDPFDARLRPPQNPPLSAYYGRTIYAVDVEGDLRAVFYIERDCVVTVDIGTHDIYRG